MTRLDEFMFQHRISNVRLATRAGITAQYLGGLRLDTSEPPLPTMRNVASAASEIVRRKVRVTELFDLGDDER